MNKRSAKYFESLYGNYGANFENLAKVYEKPEDIQKNDPPPKEEIEQCDTVPPVSEDNVSDITAEYEEVNVEDYD